MGANLKEVARHAGVSAATASRVLSGSSYPVSAAVRERVEMAAATLDYVPNAQARALITGRGRSIGILVGDVGDPYFSAMIKGVHVAAAEMHSLVTIIATGRDVALELDSFRLLQSHSASAIVVAGSGIDDDGYRSGLSARIRAFPGRVVLVGRHEVEPDVEAVKIEHDNVGGGRLVGQHLRELGHERVALLTGVRGLSSTEDRIRGVTEGLSIEPLRLEVSPTTDGGYSGMRQVHHEHPEVTAVVGTADQMAIGALDFCRDHDVRVPEDLSLVGFNDIWVARRLRPRLTTVRLALEDVGREAVRLAFADDEDSFAIHKFPAELVTRESTGSGPTGRTQR